MKKYCIEKKKSFVANSKLEPITGMVFNPKNNIDYDGIRVSKVTLVDHSFIKKVVKKKAKKIDQYLNLMLFYLNSEEDDGSSYHHVLNEMSRFKDILNYRYGKYLEEKYKKLLFEKMNIIQGEILGKLMQADYLKEHSTRKR